MAQDCEGHGHGHGHGHEDGCNCDTDAAAQPAPHVHGPNCGHLAVQVGNHIGFRDNTGDIAFYQAPDSVKLEDLCFEQHESGDDPSRSVPHCSGCEQEVPHLHAHLRQECSNGTPEMKRRTVALQASSTVPEMSGYNKDHTSKEVRRDCGHEHSAACGHPIIKHGDHYDYLVESKDGVLELHHPVVDGGSKYCVVHGALHSAQGVDTTWTGWMNLFVFKPVREMLSLLSHGHISTSEVRTTMVVEGICCPSEVQIIEKLLKPLPGVTSVAVNVTARTTAVEHDANLVTAADLVLALNSASLGAYLKTGSTALTNSAPRWNVWVCGLLFFLSLVSIPGHEQQNDDDSVEPAMCQWCEPFKWCAIAAIGFGWPPILKKAFGALQSVSLDINTLMSLAVVGAICIDEYVEGAAVVFLFAVSEWLETRATQKARVAISEVIALVPDQALLKNTGEYVPVNSVAVGTTIIIKPGAKIPLDGDVSKGSSTVDEAAITGESRPVKKSVGSPVFAGTVNQAGHMEVISTKNAGDSAASQLVRLIEDAQAQRSPTELVVDRFAKIYTPIVVLTALLMATVPWVATDKDNALDWVYSSLVLIVAACPCALVISTPITYVCALALTARNGILVKGGKHLETLGRVKTIAIDKTGTLTEGRFRLLNLLSVDPKAYTRTDLLSLAASLENCSSHPLAAAVVATARSEGISVQTDVSEFATLAGEGLTGVVGGKRIHIGNQRLANRLGWLRDITNEDDGMLQAAKEWEEQAQTVCWLGIDGSMIAVFGVADKIRDEAHEAITQLMARGIRIVMLTGDNEGTASAVKHKLGMSEVKANLLPDEKVNAVAALRQDIQSEAKGMTVAMVGDGINDAPALSRADVGIAMGAGGTAAAMETADVALMDSSLLKLARAQDLGSKCLVKIKQNVAFSLASKLIMVGLAIGGYATLWIAVIADVGAMLIVCLNGMTRTLSVVSVELLYISQFCCVCIVLESEDQKQFGHAHGHGHGQKHGCCGEHNNSTAEGCENICNCSHIHEHSHTGDSRSCDVGDQCHGHGHADVHNRGRLVFDGAGKLYTHLIPHGRYRART